MGVGFPKKPNLLEKSAQQEVTSGRIVVFGRFLHFFCVFACTVGTSCKWLCQLGRWHSLQLRTQVPNFFFSCLSWKVLRLFKKSLPLGTPLEFVFSQVLCPKMSEKSSIFMKIFMRILFVFFVDYANGSVSLPGNFFEVVNTSKSRSKIGATCCWFLSCGITKNGKTFSFYFILLIFYFVFLLFFFLFFSSVRVACG